MNILQSVMLVLAGFLAAGLIALMVAPAYWARAVRLTTRRLRETMPLSEAEIRAAHDRLRAQFALKVHQLERENDQGKLSAARQLIEINRRDARISALETDLEKLKVSLEENQNARRVLEQTVADRLPKVEQRLAEAKKHLFDRDRDIAEITRTTESQKAALAEARQINAQQTAELERLNQAMTSRGLRNRDQLREAGFEGEAALRSEIEALRAKTREQALLISRLQGQMSRSGHGASFLPPETPVEKGPAVVGAVGDGEVERLRRELGEARSELTLLRAANGGVAPDRRALEDEVRKARALADDQAGEIARLRAAVAAFEAEQTGDDRRGTLRESKVALKARLNSAEAHASQQGDTIQRLRAELVAANERLARQGAQFMDEMKRLGAGARQTGGAIRPVGDGRRRSLAERIAQPRPTRGEGTSKGEAGAGEHEHASNGTAHAPVVAVVETAGPGQPPASPLTGQGEAVVNAPRRRLVDRIAGMTAKP